MDRNDMCCGVFAGDEAYMFRDALAHLFTPEAVQSYQDTVHRWLFNFCIHDYDVMEELDLY